MSLLDDCIAAHGGDEAFAAVEAIDLRLRVGGLALAMKLRGRALADRRVTVALHEPAVTFDGLGIWHGIDPRPAGMPWRLPWTDADVLHFAGYALWNYLAAPFIWRRCAVRELPHRRLELTFPGDLPTHSPHQTAHLDDQARIARLDYTALVFGPWARAQNACLRYQCCGGLLIPTRRRVTPRPLHRTPTLVSVALDELRTAPAARSFDEHRC